MGFDTRHFRIFRLYGFAKKIGTDQSLVKNWLSQYLDGRPSRMEFGSAAQSFGCGKLIEFHAQRAQVNDPRRGGSKVNRWHIYRSQGEEHSKRNLDAYLGNLHVDWHPKYERTAGIENIELCVLPVHQAELLKAIKDELLILKMSA